MKGIEVEQRKEALTDINESFLSLPLEIWLTQIGKSNNGKWRGL